MPPRTRIKEVAKKRRHDEAGSSSRPARGQSDLLIPGSRGLSHLNVLQLLKVQELRSKMVSGGYYFDYPLLDTYGCRERVEWLTAQPYWTRLFGWRGDTYEPVIYEFIASLEITEVNHQFTPSIKFSLFGVEYHISVDQLGIYLGFYTREDRYAEWYANLLGDFDSDATMEEYWHRITGGSAGRFAGKKHNTGVIRCPALKAVKLLLGLTFGGRRKNLHKIYRSDLFLLRSMDMNEPIQMACMVKRWLQTQAGDKCPYIWIGPILTQLCEGMGLQDRLRQEKRTVGMDPLGLDQLKRGYIQRIDDNPDDADDEPQAPAPAMGEGQGAPKQHSVPPQYPEVHDWASMRAFQYQLYTDTIDTFNRRIDYQDGVLAGQSEMMARHDQMLARQDEIMARQNEMMARQDERMTSQYDAIEQLRHWMETRFPPPSQGGDGSY